MVQGKGGEQQSTAVCSSTAAPAAPSAPATPATAVPAVTDQTTATAPNTAATESATANNSGAPVDDKKSSGIEQILSIASTILGFVNPIAGGVVGILGKLGDLFKGGLGNIFKGGLGDILKGGLGGLFDGGISKLLGDGVSGLFGGALGKATNFIKKGLSIFG
jgi:hypothetical protein